MDIALFLVGGLLLLALGGELLVRGAVRVAECLGISPLLIGLTLVGFGTSTPDLVTSAQAALPADFVRMLIGPASPGLRVGAPADVTIVDLDNARCQPVHSTASALIYNANGADVHTVIVAGDILLDAGRVTTVDEAALRDEGRRAARDLMRRAGVNA